MFSAELRRAARRYALLPLLLAAAPLWAAEMPAVLVADLEPGVGPAPPLEPQELAAIGGRLYFSGFDPAHGREPWVSDGTAAGTRRLADLCPGTCSSDPTDFRRIGDKTVVFARLQLLVHAIGDDGGVEALDRVFGFRRPFAQLGSVLYYHSIENDESSYGPVRKTDGTRAGTVKAEELCGGGPCRLSSLVADGNALFYVHDGTLYRLAEGGSPLALAPLRAVYLVSRADLGNGLRFLYGCDTECRVWVTDGTPAGTHRLEAAPDGRLTVLRGPIEDFLAWQGRVYFRNDARQMVSTDGTVAGTRLESRFAGPVIQLLGTTPARLFYRAGETGGEVRAATAEGPSALIAPVLPDRDGAVAVGTAGDTFYYTEFRYSALQLIAFKDTAGVPQALPQVSDIQHPAVTLAGRLYVVADPAALSRLWRADGVSPELAEVDFQQIQNLSSGAMPYRVDGSLAVLAGEGSEASPRKVLAVNPETLALRDLAIREPRLVAADHGRLFLQWPYGLISLEGLPGGELRAGHPGLYDPEVAGGAAVAEDGRLYYTDTGAGQKLWESSLVEARVLFDLRPGWACGPQCPQRPGPIVASGRNIFFLATAASPDALALWSWRQGDTEPRRLLRVDGEATLTAAPGGRLLLAHRLPGLEGDLELWQSDGTPAGTTLFERRSYKWRVEGTAVAGSRFFLMLRHFWTPPSYELLVTDFTPAGTLQLPFAPQHFYEMKAAGNRVFFTFDLADEIGAELGVSDGTLAGTRTLDLRPGFEGSRPQSLFGIAHGRLVFSASPDDAGAEPWISDGTLDGTHRLADVAPGSASSSPSHFAQVGGKLFFQADDGTTGREPWALELPPLPPCPAEKLCLRGGRFEVSAEVLQNGQSLAARRVFAAEESGVFSFFSPGNWEMLVKVLDGCGLNDAFWVYAAAATDVPYRLTVLDRFSGATREYDSAGLARPILDSAAFATCAAEELPPAYSPGSAIPPASPCADDPQALCLGSAGRYRVSQSWRTASESGRAQPVEAGSADSGLFSFFSPGNWESMVKVLDGCAINGKVWVFAAGTTDVGWTLEVEDRDTGARKIYENPLGQPSRTVADISAFDCP